MPDLLTAETVDQRTKIANAITHFLVAGSPRKFQYEAIEEVSEGKALFHSVGCIACHSPRDETGKEVTREGVVDLGHVTREIQSFVVGRLSFSAFERTPIGPDAGHEVDAG